MPFDYAPAPESRSIVDVESNYGLFIGGSFSEPTSGEFFKTINPATEEVLSEVAEAGQADVDAAVAAARRAYDKTWSKMSGKDRAKYIFRIARLIQERSRELAVLETLDNGKPIRESRDVDLPLVAAHFFYHAGWADKSSSPATGPTRVSRRRRAGDSVELPIVDACLEGRPALACAAMVVLKPAKRRHSPLSRSPTSVNKPDSRRAASTSSPVPARQGACSSNTRTWTRLPSPARPRLGKPFSGRSLAPRRRRPSSWWQGGQHRLRRRSIDQAIEGIVNGIYFNQGHVCCAGSRLRSKSPSPTKRCPP